MPLTTITSTLRKEIPAGTKVYLQQRVNDGSIQIHNARNDTILAILLDPKVMFESYGPKRQTQFQVSGWVIVDGDRNYQHKVFIFTS